MSHPMSYMYFQGQVIPAYEAKISIAAHSLQYGTTCFAGIRGYAFSGHYKVFRLKDHHCRLMQGSKILGFNFEMPYEQFESAIEALIRKNAPAEDFYIRLFVYCGEEKLTPAPKGLNFQFACYLVPLKNYFDPQNGLRLMISNWRKFSDTALPTKAKAGGCYINSFLATGDAQARGFDEALMMDDQGFIVEASVANILLVKRGKVISPPAGAAMLEGITWRTAVECLEMEGIKVQFETIDRSSVYTADELILLGTAAQVAYAESVDGREIGTSSIGPGKMTVLLREKFDAILQGTHPKTAVWIKEISKGVQGEDKI